MSGASPETLLSVCIPTHHGRRGPLARLLEQVISQAAELPGRVEVCVSDNASHDGTAELLADLAARAPCPVVYRHHDADRGLASNLLAVVELARGTHCWLLGSDDLLAEGALRMALAHLRAMPEAAGHAVGAVHVDADDPSLRSVALARGFHPAGEDSRLIEGVDAVYEQCGNSWCALSWSIVRREDWLRVARAHRERAPLHGVFPQVVIMAGMAAERPSWGWLAEPLVHQRNATTFLFEDSASPVAERWSAILAGAAAAWREALGGGSRRWCERMRGLNRVWGGAGDVRATKLYERPSPRAQGRLALASLRAFWPVRSWWREVLPAALMPVWLTRARYGARGRWPAGGVPDAGALTLSGSLPGTMRRAGVASVGVIVANGGAGTIACAGARTLTVGQRWFDRDGRQLEPDRLGVNRLAAPPQSLPRAIRRGADVDVELALYARPAEPGPYRLVVSLHRHGVGWLDELNPDLRLEREVLVSP